MSLNQSTCQNYIQERQVVRFMWMLEGMGGVPRVYINGGYVIPKDQEEAKLQEMEEMLTRSENMSSTRRIHLVVYLKYTSLMSVSISFLHRLVNRMVEQFPNLIETCELYDAPVYMHPIVNLIVRILRPDLRSRIVFKKTVSGV